MSSTAWGTLAPAIGAAWLCVMAAAAQAQPAAAPAGAVPASGAPPASSQTAPAQALFEYRQVMVPMRDGVHLQTVILTPVSRREPLPILMRRTPYGVPMQAPTEMPPDLKELAADGYIFVIQNIRGRFGSEGTFTLANDVRVDPGKGTIETRDAWDTVAWLIKNVPGNNGRVGIFGVSYDGYTAGATLLDPHPALKAVSEQASPVDQWMNDDDHRYGALRLSYDFEYAVMEEADKNANTHFGFDRWDTYEWYLAVGPLSVLNDRYVHGKIPYWNETIQHPDYDSFWKAQAWAQSLHRATTANLNVAGFWDQEDPWGPWQIFRHAREHDPRHTTLIAAGPWNHGGWRRSTTTLGAVALGEDTALSFRQKIEAPFFAYWLHGKGAKPAWTAMMFQTGSNSWKTYESWPPAGALEVGLYLHADGTLSFSAPQAAEEGAHRDYVSDPANPVPYRERPISPTYPGGDWRTWESSDQRFVDHRPDVLTFVSAPLERDLVIAGPVAAKLFASSSGTDSDFVVKLIDVFAENSKAPTWSEESGPKPGDYAQSVNGYELPIAMEVRRGRYLKSFEHPSALEPNVPIEWEVPLRDRDHVFLKGHRIMVQIQSTWFPLIDRNPQRFVPSIYEAKAEDFVSATQRVYCTPRLPSRIVLPVMSESSAAQISDPRVAAAVRSIEDLIGRSGADVAIAFRTLDGKAQWLRNADESFHAASTMKVPVLIELYHQVQERTLRLDDQLLVKNEFRSLADGSAYALDPKDDSELELYRAVGSSRTLRELSELMITMSSNLATNLIIERLGVEPIRRTVHALEADGMDVRRGVEDSKAFQAGLNNTTTARGLMQLMDAIAQGRAIDRNASRQMLEVLSRQTFNDGIPAGLPTGIRVAHKTGDITRIWHDAGVVLAPRPYVLVVLTRGLEDPKQSTALIAAISRELYRATQ